MQDLFHIGLGSLLALGFFSLVAGFIDAVVGGGGLIQLPALLLQLPTTSLPTILGTNKIAALSGTSVAAMQYARRIRFNFPLLFVISCVAFMSSHLGAQLASRVDPATFRPLILLILILIAIYTYLKKDLGTQSGKVVRLSKQYVYGSLMALLIGFYDGFIGPGTGSFLVLAFVVFLGFEFVQASAYAKFVNCMTNFSAVMVFVKQGNYLFSIAMLMAVCNVVGNIVGSMLALKKGNAFVRLFFLLVVCAMILRYSYTIFFS
ncbi:MAG: TSUP family transporter [Bacteroidota bacterium]|nr:TSUP family transporter [Bacteroidota bacterium]